MGLTSEQQKIWEDYLGANRSAASAFVEASVAGNTDIADQLLALYLNGKKTAGSGLKIDYERSGDPLPEVGNYWIVLDSKNVPRCIVRTVRVEFHRFDEVGDEIAIAEGEGDLSVEYWRSGHRNFFEPYLAERGISDLNSAVVVTEFFELVHIV